MLRPSSAAGVIRSDQSPITSRLAIGAAVWAMAAPLKVGTDESLPPYSFVREGKAVGIDVDWYTTRERELAEVLPWDHLDAGLDRDWLWEDWQDALDEQPVEDCRWTPCYDCGVCPQMGTDIEIGPTGKTLLPLTVLGSGREAMLEGARD